jgi:hypothetical protein
MTTMAQLRKAALALPETEEGTHFGRVAFTVRGRVFAAVTKDGRVQLQVCDSRAEEFLERHSEGERLVRMGKPIGVLVALSDINGMVLNAMVRAAWYHRAPKRLAAELEQAEDPDAAEGDLPKSIGRPALTALSGAGLTTLDEVATRTEKDLLALHGVGPKAIRVLREALREQGRCFPPSR